MSSNTSPHQPYGPNDGYNDSSLPQLDAETRAKNLRLLRRGLVWMALGVGIMGFSFMLQYFLYRADNHAFIVPMYVLTSIGALMVMKGFIDAFGF
jgi:hypothetical protein